MKALAILAVAMGIVGCADSVSGTFCYDRQLGYNDVMDNDSLMTEWLNGSYDSTTGRYDESYRLVVEECIDGTFTK